MVSHDKAVKMVNTNTEVWTQDEEISPPPGDNPILRIESPKPLDLLVTTLSALGILLHLLANSATLAVSRLEHLLMQNAVCVCVLVQRGGNVCAYILSFCLFVFSVAVPCSARLHPAPGSSNHPP